ncbi:MAG TPA: hypothetical protein VGF84_03910 [Micromonosporaceae bacterium]|jgi:hypothetical protein
MTQAGPDGTLYRAQPQDAAVPRQPTEAIGEPAPVDTAAPATDPAATDVWSSRATTTRGMIGRPASRAALDAVASTQVVDVATTAAAGTDIAARAADVVPDPPRNGTVYGRAKADRSAKVLSGRMARLHIGWHSASISAISMIGVSNPGIGLLIGTDRHQRGVPVRFFRPEPTRIALIGGEWVAQILVFRSLALGANIAVRTVDPQRWSAFAQRVTGPSGRLEINPDPGTLPPATPHQPLLMVTDGDPAPASSARPWCTELIVLHGLDEGGIAAVQDSQLVIAQRLDGTESAIAAKALRLPGSITAPMQGIDDETVALLDRAGHLYLRINATDIERGYLGSAHR